MNSLLFPKYVYMRKRWLVAEIENKSNNSLLHIEKYISSVDYKKYYKIYVRVTLVESTNYYSP